MDLEELDSEDYTTKFSDYFDFKAIIGKGAFGTVISAVNKSDSREYAIKVIQKQYVSPKDWERLRQEAHILSDLNHPNIVRFKDIKETEKRIFLVMELVQGGQLKDLIEARVAKGETFSDDEVHTLMKSIFSAVRYLHSKEIVHRDLKPENILLHNRNDLSSIKIADFGLSTQFSQDGFVRSLRQRCGTMIYMAPELALDEQYGKPVDIWSCGLIMYILLSGGKHPLYHSKDTPETFLEKLKKPNWIFGENFSSIAQNFFMKIMNRNPLARYTAEDLQKHPWFTRQFNDEVPLSAHEVMTSFSFEQSFTRILKALYLVNHLKFAEEGLALEDNYQNLVAKASEKHQGDEKLKPRLPRNSVMIEYNSLQSLLGISPSHQKASSSGSSPHKDDKSSINLLPIPKHKFHTEETKSKDQEVKKEEQEISHRENSRKAKNDSSNTLKLPDIPIHNEIPSRNSSPFAISIPYPYKNTKSNSNMSQNANNQTIPIDQSESPNFTLQTDPEEEVDALEGLNHFVSPVSAKGKKKKLFLFKNLPDEQGFESDHPTTNGNKLAEELFKNRSPSLNQLKAFKLENSNNSSYISDESTESANDNPRALTTKELQKPPKKSPFFHNAQKPPSPILKSNPAKNKASSFTHKSHVMLPNLKSGTKELLTLPPITPTKKDLVTPKKKDDRAFNFKTSPEKSMHPTAIPSTSKRNKPIIEAPEALFFGPKTLNTPKKDFKGAQDFRAIVGFNVKESQENSNSRKKLLSVLKNDN